MCPNRRCHNMVKSNMHDEISLGSGKIVWWQLLASILPNSLYSISILIPLINTNAPYTILHVSFSNTFCTPTSLILMIDMIFWAKLGICNTLGRVPLLRFVNISQIFPCPMVLVNKSSPRTSPPNSSYSQNQFLWGFIWNDATYSISHESRSHCVLIKAKYASPFSSCVNLLSVNYISSEYFLVLDPFNLQSLL